MTRRFDPLGKSFLTNLAACLCIVAGVVSPVASDHLLAVGLFALSGAFTNWLAIFMLFEKVPGLYGSGVVPSRFEDFKSGIHDLVMTQFFTEANLERFLGGGPSEDAGRGSGGDRAGVEPSPGPLFDPEPVLDTVDYDAIFEGMVEVIQQSQFGGMLSMVGGAAALAPLKDPMSRRMREMILDIALRPEFQLELRRQLAHGRGAHDLLDQVDHIVTQRLDELTPRMVKEIVQEMIRRHLGWLVVWGGVFGGLIGLVTSLTRAI